MNYAVLVFFCFFGNTCESFVHILACVHFLLEILLLPNFDVGNNTCLAFLFMMCMLSYIALE